MEKSARVRDLEASLNACQMTQTASKGYKRVFFLTLFVALLLQAFCFFYMQVRTVSETLIADFKIILTVSHGVTPARINEIGDALSANVDVVSLKFISADDGFQIIKEQNPKLAENFVFLGRKPMAEYFELTLSENALPEASAWITENIVKQIPDVTPHYKEEQALAAAYASNIVRALNLIAALTLVVLFSFVFFVEGYSIKTPGVRWPSVFIGILSFGISLGVFYGLLQPLKTIAGDFFVFTILEVQCIILFITALLGWVLSKWKRF
ncbi:hypothetical protein Emin_1219 [Elusimicrobium minutum Pei191]|uniref:Uncharacterized protein n=1 Tax=Elusimicrobium minutum (strain Pei191) TaxID=445932 RepID=B2KE23_ELUMP|nr:permease-like cell division protein FtsX [Elusimicrobium minutum]ACC98769.1 hypothetical protein Emin_1219 [Elusimicrobium minutum Pei191]